ncbi:MAG TPA: polymer-forming cytoskeletal protein [Candidatus Acidoferrales bacterium]|nr:polymer-forming cytoskeletal protein [Candidatus Acidoferrales bacterium]
MSQPDISHTGSPHFDEMTGLLYLEQQLDDLHSKMIAEHANACATCRELLRVLKNESVWLREALVADDEPVPVRFAAAPARNIASWGWLATLGFGAAGAYTLWIGFIEPWVTQASNIGLTQGNLMTMLFFSGAFWNGWADLATGVEFMAMVTLGVVAAWALRRYFRRQAGTAAVMGMLGLAILAPAPARAAETVHGNPSYTLPAGQEIKTDLFVAGDHVLIDGTVDGDLVVWAHEVEVNGQVKGDIIAFTQELRMNGTVGGNVRAFAESTVLSGSVGKNLMGFVRSVELDEKSTIDGSATLFSRDVQLNGPVKGDLLAMAGTMEIDGPIGGNVKVRGEDMRIGSTAQIAGRTQFEGPKQPEIAAGAKLASPVEMIMRKATPMYSTWSYYWHQILRWGAAFLLGLVMFLLAPGAFLDAANSANKVGLSMGIGLLFLVGIPVAAIIACITIVGLGVGITTVLIYLVAVYMSQVFVGEWLGEKLLGVGVGIGPVLARLALGLAILRVVRVIPFLGPLSMWVVIVWGLGAYVLTLHKRMRHQVITA